MEQSQAVVKKDPDNIIRIHSDNLIESWLCLSGVANSHNQ